jgi:GTPase SAR1 family protein
MGVATSLIPGMASATRPNNAAMLLGLDGAGKTTLFRRLTFNPDRPSTYATAQPPRPTKGAVRGEALVANATVDVVDVGGLERFLWAQHINDFRPDIVIFVVDGTDRTRFGEARDALENVLKHDTVVKDSGHESDAQLIVLLSKADLEECVSMEEFEQAMNLKQLLADAVTNKRGARAVLAPGSVCLRHVVLRISSLAGSGFDAFTQRFASGLPR